jgi:4-amino-4-deoxy-L-arabinose transferase-like glycosyltransferase
MRYHRLVFWLILSVALIARIAAAMVLDQHVREAGRTFLIEGDANGYWELAQRLAAGEDYSIYTPPRRVLRMPGFPLLLAASIRVFGPSVLAATIVLSVVGTGCCWLTWLLARRVFGEATALVAFAVTAVSPLLIGSSVQVLSETWFAFWMLLCLLSLRPLVVTLNPANAAAGPSPGAVAAVIQGLLTGLTVLVRPGWILWAGFSPLLILVARNDWSIQRRLKAGALVMAGCLLALLPWAWRNHAITGHWVFTSLWSGPSLYDGLNPTATGASDMQFVDSENVYSTMTEFDANEHYKQRAWDFVRSHPRRTMELAVAKAARFLSPTLNAAGYSGGLFSLVCLSWYLVFVASMVVGARGLTTRWRELLLLAGPMLLFLPVHMVFVGSVRYRLPVEFPLAIIAAQGLTAAVGGWWERDRGKASQDGLRSQQAHGG